MTVELIAKYLRNTEISPEILYQKFLEKDGVTNTHKKSKSDREKTGNSALRV